MRSHWGEQSNQPFFVGLGVDFELFPLCFGIVGGIIEAIIFYTSYPR
jgi:hypothetical protein